MSVDRSLYRNTEERMEHLEQENKGLQTKIESLDKWHFTLQLENEDLSSKISILEKAGSSSASESDACESREPPAHH